MHITHVHGLWFRTWVSQVVYLLAGQLGSIVTTADGLRWTAKEAPPRPRGCCFQPPFLPRIIPYCILSSRYFSFRSRRGFMIMIHRLNHTAMTMRIFDDGVPAQFRWPARDHVNIPPPVGSASSFCFCFCGYRSLVTAAW